MTSRAWSAVAVAMASVALSAQVRYRVNEPGRWRPWQFTAIASARSDRGATAADVQAFEARLLELGQIVQRTPIVSKPVGFSAGPHGYLAGYSALAPGEPAGRTVPLAGGYAFGAFSLFEYDRAGKTVREESVATELLYFEINQIGRGIYGATRPSEWESVESEAFIQPDGGASLAGHPRAGNVFVVKKNPKPLWGPVALADALLPVVTVRRELYDSRRASYEKQSAEFVQWQTPAARAARRADWQKTAAMLPNGPEFLKNMEDADRQIEASNRASLAPGGPDARGVAASEREFREADAALASLSASQRAAPACYDSQMSALTSRFRAVEGAPGSCRALVRPNWTYFDPKLPRAAPQVVMISLFDRCLTPESLANTTPAGCTINRKLIETLDWGAVLAWLDR